MHNDDEKTKVELSLSELPDKLIAEDINCSLWSDSEGNAVKFNDMDKELLLKIFYNFNRVPDRERARLGGSSYEEYSVYCIGGGSIYQNRRSGRCSWLIAEIF